MRRPMPKRVRQKISKAKRGKSLSPETRQKISEARRAYLARQRNHPRVEGREDVLAEVSKTLQELIAIWRKV